MCTGSLILLLLLLRCISTLPPPLPPLLLGMLTTAWLAGDLYRFAHFQRRCCANPRLYSFLCNCTYTRHHHRQGKASTILDVGRWREGHRGAATLATLVN